MTFWFPSWRSLSPLKGHLTIPKRSQRIARGTSLYYHLFSHSKFILWKPQHFSKKKNGFWSTDGSKSKKKGNNGRFTHLFFKVKSSEPNLCGLKPVHFRCALGGSSHLASKWLIPMVNESSPSKWPNFMAYKWGAHPNHLRYLGWSSKYQTPPRCHRFSTLSHCFCQFFLRRWNHDLRSRLWLPRKIFRFTKRQQHHISSLSGPPNWKNWVNKNQS